MAKMSSQRMESTPQHKYDCQDEHIAMAKMSLQRIESTPLHKYDCQDEHIRFERAMNGTGMKVEYNFSIKHTSIASACVK